MSNVTEICNVERIFSIEEANAMVSLVREICTRCQKRIDRLVADHNWYVQSGAPEAKSKECDEKMHKEIMKCGTKLTKLGIKVLGDYYMGFYAGSSFYWSYRFPELKIEYWHGLMENPRISRHRLEYLQVLK